MPVVRTYISLPAGIAKTNLGQFALFTFLGSLIWSFVLAFVGYNLGDKIVQLSTFFHGFDIVILLLLAVGVGYYIYRHLQKDRSSAVDASAKAHSGGESAPRVRP